MLIMDVGTYTIAPIKMKNLGINTIKYIQYSSAQITKS